jgi:hypothetical protein
MTTEYKTRLKNAVKRTVDQLGLDNLHSQRLFTPVWRDRKYRWISPMDSDGLLVKRRRVELPKTTIPRSKTYLQIGVIIQSEFTTSIAKANPFGKALISALPSGVWVDLSQIDRKKVKRARRIRLDRIFVLFVLPHSTGQGHISKAARANVTNAMEASVESEIIEVEKGASTQTLADQLMKEVRPWLIGAGRPRS